jgi:hypothetical protein
VCCIEVGVPRPRGGPDRAGAGQAGSDKFLCAGEIDGGTGPLLFGRRGTALCSVWVSCCGAARVKGCTGRA